MGNHFPPPCEPTQVLLCDARLKRIDDAIGAVLSEQAKQKETLYLIDTALRGNGVPGLKEQVRVLNAKEAARSRLFWIVVGTAVAQVATLGVAGLLYLHSIAR
jgi:hypothetical protein